MTSNHNTKLSLPELKLQAEQGDMQAQFALGLYYLPIATEEGWEFKDKLYNEYGLAVLDATTIDNRIFSAFYLGDPGFNNIKETNDELAFGWLKKAAEHGMAVAQYATARCYFEGRGTEQSDKLAFEWAEKSSKQGLGEAFSLLGDLYNTGRGVIQNDKRALECYEKAVDDGERRAYFKLIRMTLSAKGIVDYSKARKSVKEFKKYVSKQFDKSFDKCLKHRFFGQELHFVGENTIFVPDDEDLFEESFNRIRHNNSWLIKTLYRVSLAAINYKKEVEEKNKELNNLIAMFAHNFLGTLQCIRSNAEHDNNPAIHLKTVKMMGGALTAFSILSADDDKLVEQLKQDNTGEMNLQQNLANNLALAISQLLGKTNKDKIVNLYLQHLRKTKQIGIETSSEELRFNRDYREMWQALQHQWEDEFNALFSEHVELLLLQKWLADNFFPVEITGFDSHNISFREYGITDSIFLIVFMEIFVNAFKYMDVSKNEPLTLMLCEENQCYKLVCENPSTQETGRGTHKGMDFLRTIAKKLGGQFITEVTGNSFKSTFTIPSELLK